MIYYVSDTHFGDDRIRILAHRPFQTVEDMDAEMIRRWNNRVLKEDKVYIIGDFAVSDEVAKKVLPKLNGKKHLILGNHDAVLTDETLRFFSSVDSIKTIADNGKSVCLCHYPLLSYENSVYGGYQIFGHIHNNPNDIAYKFLDELPNHLHCGVDVNGFTPQTLDELIRRKKID